MSWCPPDLRKDPEIKEIFDRTMGYRCPEVDEALDAIRGHSPVTDRLIVMIEELREGMIQRAQGMLDLAVLAAMRDGRPHAVNPDNTHPSVIARRKQREQRARERLRMLAKEEST